MRPDGRRPWGGVRGRTPASPLSEGTPSPGRPAFAPPEARSPSLLWGFMVASLPRHDRLNPWPLAAELSLQFRSAPQRSGVEVEMNPPSNDELAPPAASPGLRGHQRSCHPQTTTPVSRPIPREVLRAQEPEMGTRPRVYSPL